MLRILAKRCFTLLEVLLVVGLVTIVAGAVAINIASALMEQRFRGEVATVVNTLRLAQQLMLIVNTDVTVKFTPAPNNAGMDYTLEFDDPLNANWKREIQRTHPPLKEIHSISFGEAKGKINLRFFSNGTDMSQGNLLLSTHEKPESKGALNSYICLPGFPHFIQSRSEKNDAACDVEAQKSYNQRLTQHTIGEVSEKLRQYKDEKKDDKKA